jgi:hypothetical protein
MKREKSLSQIFSLTDLGQHFPNIYLHLRDILKTEFSQTPGTQIPILEIAEQTGLSPAQLQYMLTNKNHAFILPWHDMPATLVESEIEGPLLFVPNYKYEYGPDELPPLDPLPQTGDEWMKQDVIDQNQPTGRCRPPFGEETPWG